MGGDGKTTEPARGLSNEIWLDTFPTEKGISKQYQGTRNKRRLTRMQQRELYSPCYQPGPAI